jgi:lipid A 4'-phosphatase
MGYLKLKRGRILLSLFAIFALSVAIAPDIDIQVAGLFFDGRSFAQRQWWQNALHHGVGYFLAVSAIAVVGIYLFNRVTSRSIAGIDGRRALFVVLVIVMGPGLIVNATLKDQFGRARPRDIVEFGGTREFTPAFVVSNECRTNCSFSSGDAAAGFCSIALAMALSRRRRYMALGVTFGVLVSVARMAAGAHYLSDIVTSFFIVLILSDVLFLHLVLRQADARASEVPTGELEPVIFARQR